MFLPNDLVMMKLHSLPKTVVSCYINYITLYYFLGCEFFSPSLSFKLQASGGTISQLRQFLVELNRSDAVNIIDRAMESKNEEENSASTGEGSSSSHDSGEMGECWCSSYVLYISKNSFIQAVSVWTMS